MAGNNIRTSPGGLSRRPRILFLGTVVLGFAVLVGLWAYGLVVNKDVSPNAAGTLLLGILTLGPGCILARLASPGEANPWRTMGIWIALLSYIGSIAAVMLVLIGDAIWMAGGGKLIILNDLPQPGLVDSAAAGVFVAGDILVLPALLVFVPAGLYTFWVYWKTPRREPDARSERARRVTSGFEVGAAVTATLLAVLGLAYAFLWHYLVTPAMAVWPDGGRIVIFGVAIGLAASLVAVGGALHLCGGLTVLPGQALLWIGAVVLTLAGALDSFSATSLSGTTGTYVSSAGGESDVLLNHWVGLGTFLLPTGVVALLLAISVTHIHLPRHLHLPRYHRHTATINAT